MRNPDLTNRLPCWQSPAPFRHFVDKRPELPIILLIMCFVTIFCVAKKLCIFYYLVEAELNTLQISV